MSFAYAGDNFVHGQFIFLTMDVDISSLVDKYKWVKSSCSSLDDHAHYQPSKLASMLKPNFSSLQVPGKKRLLR